MYAFLPLFADFLMRTYCLSNINKKQQWQIYLWTTLKKSGKGGKQFIAMMLTPLRALCIDLYICVYNTHTYNSLSKNNCCMWIHTIHNDVFSPRMLLTSYIMVFILCNMCIYPNHSKSHMYSSFFYGFAAKLTSPLLMKFKLFPSFNFYS